MGKERIGGGTGGESGGPVEGQPDEPPVEGQPDEPPVDSRVARRRQDPIGRRLRKMYTDVVDEHLPDDFLSFLEEADFRTYEPGRTASNGADPTIPPKGDANQPER